MVDTMSNMSSFGWSSMALFFSWRTLVFIFMLTNLKSLHFMWFVMQPYKKSKTAKGQEKEDVDTLKSAFASSVARYVFKNNRRTIPPEEALRKCNLLPNDEATLADIEKKRASSLAVGRLEAGWDAVHNCLQPTGAALGWYHSAY